MKKSIGPKTIVFPTPVFIIGTYGKNDKPNAMAVAWGGVCCSEPPCVAISIRKTRCTYGNLITHNAFTVNIPSEQYVKEADYFGIASGHNQDKFAVAGLRPVKSDLVHAPYIKEFPMILECKVIHAYEIGVHTQFIGEILDVKVDINFLNDKNIPLIEEINPFCFTPGSQQYNAVGKRLCDAYKAGKDLVDKGKKS